MPMIRLSIHQVLTYNLQLIRWIKILSALPAEPYLVWALTVNVDKTKYMIISKSNRVSTDGNSNVNITYNGHFLERVKKYEYLGFTIDDKIKNEYHNKLISKASIKCNYWVKSEHLLIPEHQFIYLNRTYYLD